MRDIEKLVIDGHELDVGTVTVKELKKFQTLSKKLDNLKDLPEDDKQESTLKEVFLFICKVNKVKITDEEYEELSLIPLTKIVNKFSEKNGLTDN